MPSKIKEEQNLTVPVKNQEDNNENRHVDFYLLVERDFFLLGDSFELVNEKYKKSIHYVGPCHTLLRHGGINLSGAVAWLCRT